MEAYLNDLSISGGQGSLLENWRAVNVFDEMLSKLKPYGLQLVVVPDDCENLLICGYRLSDCYVAKDNPLGERRQVLVQMLKCFRKLSATYWVEDTMFEPTVAKGDTSLLLGAACAKKLPAVSFLFDTKFACSPLKGQLIQDFWVEKKNQINTQSKESELINFFDESLSGAKYLVPLSASQDKNPLTDPLWNVDLSRQYLEDADFSADYIAEHPSEKHGYLKIHATAIAELNGWRIDENLSKKNSNSEHERVIFYSANFRHKSSYLSIDFEKEEVYFELFNHRGRHQGEKKWDGSDSQVADNTGRHDIIV